MTLKNKNIVVFGGATGIGYAIAKKCAEQGANIFIASRSEKSLKSAQENILKELNKEVHIHQCDVTKTEDIIKLYEEVESHDDGLYGLVFCSGVIGPLAPMEQTELDKWIECVDINLLGAARSIHLALNEMKKRKQGRIVLMSGGGQSSLPSYSAYVSAKGGIWRLTETLGAELAPHNIFINAIAPGAVNTQILDEVLKAGADNIGQEHYQQRIEQQKKGGITPDKAAECALYLLSDESKGLHGKVLSAVWDPYKDFQDLENISNSDIFTMKRVIQDDGGTRFKKG